MRLCLLTTSLPLHQMGGTEVHAESLAAEAARQGHEVFVVTTAHPQGLKTERRDGFTAIYLEGTSHTMSRREAPAWWRESARRTAALCAEKNIDVVWAENFAGLAYAALPRSERRPVVSIVNGMAVRGEIASNFNRVSTAGELFWFLTRYAAQTLFYYIPRFRALVRDSDMLIGVSHASTEAVLAEFPSAAGKVRTILNQVDTSRFAPDPASGKALRERLGIAADAPVVLMAGVLHKQKGVHLGLEVFASLTGDFPEARLIVVGDGPQRAELEALSDQLGLSGKALFCGLKNNAEMRAYYNAADVYLNPTLRSEGLPMVLIEAMACGLPAVVTKIGGTASSIDDGVSGYFTRPGDLEGIGKALRLLLGDSALRARLSAGAREKAVAVFAKEKCAGAYLAASRELVAAYR